MIKVSHRSRADSVRKVERRGDAAGHVHRLMKRTERSVTEDLRPESEPDCTTAVRGK
jgi:hypothetical protein